ncbi:MAG TPA: DUF983 domain-containing protein [Hellea balneolensis]|uniref:DUF983 domain-containing protein n=1 Tax=Hellea balneolensis TaxID=287478 RepID=A0A7C3CBJ1_9PROT|nr:DUF983 domain-containing protein [Hellea balneolensis]
MADDASKALRAGLKGRCPNCHEGRLFDGYLKFAHVCQACGFDYHSNDIADGPAVFVIFIASILVVPLALVFQIKLDPPVFVTLLIWIPAIILVCLALLRPFRGLMFALQIVHNAKDAELDEGRGEDGPET